MTDWARASAWYRSLPPPRFPNWVDQRPLIDLSERLGRLSPWSRRAAVEHELGEWIASRRAAGASGLDTGEWAADAVAELADGLWLLGRQDKVPDPDAAAEITIHMLRNVAAGRGATEYDLLGDVVIGIPESSLRRYRDAPRVRLDTVIRTLAIHGLSNKEIADKVSRKPRLGTAEQDLDPERVGKILAADPRNPVEPFSRWVRSYQHRLDVATMVRAGWKAQSARQWLRRHPDENPVTARPQ